MKCKWKDCSNDARAKSPFCSGTCKKRYQRASGTNVPVEVGQASSGTQAGQPLIAACERPFPTAQQIFDAELIKKADVKIGKHQIEPGSTNTEPPIAEVTMNPKTWPANFGQADCKCQHCINARKSGKGAVINHGKWKSYSQLNRNEFNRVALPGDSDYWRMPVHKQEQAYNHAIQKQML